MRPLHAECDATAQVIRAVVDASSKQKGGGAVTVNARWLREIATLLDKASDRLSATGAP